MPLTARLGNSNGLRIKVGVDGNGDELRVVAQHLQRDVLPRGPSESEACKVASGRAHTAAVGKRWSLNPESSNLYVPNETRCPRARRSAPCDR
jgi:hypothetical protein